MSNERNLAELLPKSEKGKLNIYFHVSENSGVGYYREYLPALTLRNHGLANTVISDFRWGDGEHVELGPKEMVHILNWADLVVVGRKDQGEFYAQWGAYKDMFKVPIIMDTDDNIEHVRPTNPGYQGYHPGSEAITWNKYGASKLFDAITVSTENLVKHYKKYNPKTYLLSNAIDVAEWNKFPKAQYHDGLIRIGFIASASHPESVHIIRKAMIEIIKRHKNVHFYLTHMFMPLFEGTERVHSIPWIHLKKFPQEYQQLGLDIGLAPLADNMFNRAKSNLRWMEYSVQGVPSIVSPVEAYKCVRGGVDALVAQEPEEWIEAIEKLVLDAELRHRLGTTAMDRIATEFNIDKNIHQWLAAYQDVVDKHRSFFGDRPEYLINNKGLREIGGGLRNSKKRNANTTPRV